MQRGSSIDGVFNGGGVVGDVMRQDVFPADNFRKNRGFSLRIDKVAKGNTKGTKDGPVVADEGPTSARVSTNQGVRAEDGGREFERDESFACAKEESIDVRSSS